ncbi:hypothetical protein NDU88_004030 [Pleurodeles waltl]|uniref:Uncharacterized protein n=1 Tax=Pleurodeles waltl TaxID=8319 RepID=A0AAV7TQ96_PLEWA|nr:hypothetical protein NDU88_004030 [Pleurodeles waltl]
MSTIRVVPQGHKQELLCEENHRCSSGGSCGAAALWENTDACQPARREGISVAWAGRVSCARSRAGRLTRLRRSALR